MRRSFLACVITAAVLAGTLSGCDRGAGEGEAGQAAHDSHAGGGSFTELSDGIELFVEYPHQILGVESEVPWEIYLTRVDGWKPVRDASVKLLMHGPRGAHQETAAEPESSGAYAAVPTLPAVGVWHAEFTLSVEGREYAIHAGDFEVWANEEEAAAHAGHSHGVREGDAHAGHSHSEDEADPHAGHDHPEDLAAQHEGHDHAQDGADSHAGHDHAQDGADPHAGHAHGAGDAAAGLITLSKVEQWSFPFAIGVAEEREIPLSIPAAGELLAPPGGLVHVSAPVAGLVQVDGPSLGPGDHVRAGQTLALIAPTSLDNSYARTRADVVAAELEAERAERLYAAGAIPARRLEEARRNLAVAVSAIEAIGGTRRAAGEDDADPDLYRLRSPIDGVVAVRGVALGEQVEIGGHAFTIVNAATLWFVARVPARYAAETDRIQGAWFTVEGGTGNWTADRVLSVGSMIDPASRTLPVRFSVRNPGGTLKVGMLAEGQIQLGAPVRGVAVPVAAIQDENGLPVVYVKLTGDAFERRVVEVGASDGSWTLVSSGIDTGEQVVTVGAYQVNLAALGVVAPAHDHAH